MAASNKPIIRIHNVETDEIIDREMSEEEFLQYKAEKEQVALEESALAEKVAQKAAILNRLGLNEEELKTILG
jgi:hypothetical protein